MDVSRTRGRPLSFDRGAALDRVLPIFWRKGLASASLDELAAAAIRGRIDRELGFDMAMAEGLADIEAGHVITDEEYLARAAERRRRWLADRAG